MSYESLVALASVASAHKKNLENAIAEFDAKRERVADSAQFLHCDHGFTANWLRHHEAISITRYAGDLRTMSRERVAMMCLFETPRFCADSLGVIMNGELYEPTGDGWSFKLKYPDREKTADAAQYLWKGQAAGGLESVLKNYDSAAIRDGAKHRQEVLCTDVADAAQYLHMVHGIDEVRFILGDRESILIMGKAAALIWRPTYPDRERTADSAQYLWKNQVAGDWVASLKIYTPLEIRKFACGRQKSLCTEVADAAWTAFDEGGYRLDLKCGSVERILDLASRAKARRVWVAPKKMIGVLKLDGFGEFGQVVKVEGIPVFDDSSASADPECEFVKSSADNHGMTVVTGIAFSFGPGIYQ